MLSNVLKVANIYSDYEKTVFMFTSLADDQKLTILILENTLLIEIIIYMVFEFSGRF